MMSPLWKTVWPLLEKLNIEFPYNSAIPHLSIHTKELKTGTQTDICTSVFTAALLMITKKWKQLKTPSIYEWINNMWYIHTIGCCSAL